MKLNQPWASGIKEFTKSVLETRVSLNFIRFYLTESLLVWPLAPLALELGSLWVVSLFCALSPWLYETLSILSRLLRLCFFGCFFCWICFSVGKWMRRYSLDLWSACVIKSTLIVRKIQWLTKWFFFYLLIIIQPYTCNYKCYLFVKTKKILKRK